MGSIISHLDDINKEYGSYENYKNSRTPSPQEGEQERDVFIQLVHLIDKYQQSNTPIAFNVSACFQEFKQQGYILTKK